MGRDQLRSGDTWRLAFHHRLRADMLVRRRGREGGGDFGDDLGKGHLADAGADEGFKLGVGSDAGRDAGAVCAAMFGEGWRQA